MASEIKKRIDNWLSDPTIFLLVVTGLTVAAGVVLAEVQPYVGYPVLLVVLGIILAVFAIAVAMIAAPLRQEMSQTLATIKGLVNPESIPWLLDTPQLATFEGKCDADEIWLLSSDLLDDSEGGPFRDVVRRKLAEGTKYVYFVPDLPELHTRVEILRNAHNIHKQETNMRFIYLPDTFFFLVPKLDIAIYNPLSHGRPERYAFMGIPDPIGTSHYHARVSVDFVDRLVGVLLKTYSQEG